MKKLVLVRHADAKKGMPINDIDRPLSRKGYTQAYEMAKQISKEKFGKTLLVTSSSMRTISTAGIFADELNYPRNGIVFESALYDTGEEEYIDCIVHTEDKYESLFIFGHNPTYNQVVHIIGKDPYEDLMPCSVVIFTIETSHWHHILGRPVSSKSIFLPK